MGQRRGCIKDYGNNNNNKDVESGRTIFEERKEDASSTATSVKVVMFIAAWYFISGTTLFLNKYVLSSLGVDPNVLGLVQMSSTAIYGAVKVNLLNARPSDSTRNDSTFYHDIALVGLMRFTTVMLGLVALKYVAVSFVETVKSSAPLFTVVFARLILGERTTAMVSLSLAPVMLGLVMTSYHESSFNLIGFAAAVTNNCVDCIQNVFSKKLLSGRYRPVELQYYTSVAALCIQVPLLLLNLGATFSVFTLPPGAVVALVLDGLSFHLQSVVAYEVMQLVSPVTASVANTAKRSLLIFISILVFGNEITLFSGLGTVVCIAGVFMYNSARTAASKQAKDDSEPPRPPLMGRRMRTITV